MKDGQKTSRNGLKTYLMELGFYISRRTWINLMEHAQAIRRTLRWDSNGATFSLASLEGVGLLEVIFF